MVDRLIWAICHIKNSTVAKTRMELLGYGTRLEESRCQVKRWEPGP